VLIGNPKPRTRIACTRIACTRMAERQPQPWFRTVRAGAARNHSASVRQTAAVPKLRRLRTVVIAHGCVTAKAPIRDARHSPKSRIALCMG
jgi:hypothetical protein